MFTESTLSKYARLLIAMTAVAVVYTVVTAIGHQQEYRRMTAETARQRASIAQLEQRVGTQSEATLSIENAIVERQSLPSSSATVAEDTDKKIGNRTLVQSIAQVLAAFDSHAVQCVAASPVDESAETSTHKITLAGSFPDVLASLESIQRQLQDSLVANLSMRCANPNQPCIWELEFRFREVGQ